MQACRRFVGPVVLAGLFAVAAPAQRQLQPFFELGIASASDPAVAEMLKQLEQQMAQFRQQLGMLPPPAQQMFAQLNRRVLPLRAHGYVPNGWNRGRTQEPDAFWLVLDTADELPLRDWLTLGSPARPGGAAPTMVPLRDLPTPNGYRWLISKDAPALDAAGDAFADGATPTMHVARARLRDVLRKSPLYVFFDLAGMLPANELAELQEVGGPTGTAFGIAASRTRGAWNVDLHWNLRPEQGLAGALLPAGQPAPKLHERLPWNPGVLMQANLGPFFPTMLREFGLERTVDPQAKEFVSCLLRCWTGEFGCYVAEPKVDDQPFEVAPGVALPPVTELVFLLSTDPESGEELITAAEKSLGALLGAGAPRRDSLGRLQFTRGELTVMADQRDGLFALCAAVGDPKPAQQNLENVLRGGGKQPARIDSELQGQAQFVVTPAFGARLAPMLRALGERVQQQMADQQMPLPLPVAMLLANRQRQESFAKLAKGFGISLRADDDGLRLRMRQ